MTLGCKMKSTGNVFSTRGPRLLPGSKEKRGRLASIAPIVPATKSTKTLVGLAARNTRRRMSQSRKLSWSGNLQSIDDSWTVRESILHPSVTRELLPPIPLHYGVKGSPL